MLLPPPHQSAGKNNVGSGKSERKDMVKWWLRAGDKSAQAKERNNKSDPRSIENDRQMAV